MIPPLTAPTLVSAPRHHGAAWSMEHLERLVDAVRETAVAGEIAGRLGRSSSTISPRCRQLLPPEERHLPGPVSIERLHERLQDPVYDWRAILLTPDRQPLVEVTHLEGWAGLEPADREFAFAAILERGEFVPTSMQRIIRREGPRDGILARIVKDHHEGLFRLGWAHEDAMAETVLWLQYRVFDGDGAAAREFTERALASGAREDARWDGRWDSYRAAEADFPGW